MKKRNWLLLLLPLLLAGCSENVSNSDSSKTNQEETTSTKSINKSSDSSPTVQQMSKWTYTSGSDPVKIINNDQPTTIEAKDFTDPHIDYSNLDNLNRTGRATAYLTKDNLGRSDSRTEQTWRPTGWHNEPKTINGKRVFPQNRGHLIAYTMTFNLNKSGKYEQGQLGSIDNPYNLFTQTEFSNQKTMQDTEQMVRTALAHNNKVIYQVTPVFRDNELMARGVWVQATTNDGSMHFNRYLWNVQNNVSFDYATGRSRIDYNFKVPGALNNNYNNNHKNHYQKWYNKHHNKKHYNNY